MMIRVCAASMHQLARVATRSNHGCLGRVAVKRVATCDMQNVMARRFVSMSCRLEMPVKQINVSDLDVAKRSSMLCIRFDTNQVTTN